MNQVVPERGARLDVIPEFEVSQAIVNLPPRYADGIQGVDTASWLNWHDEVGSEIVVPGQDVVHRLAQHLLYLDERRQVRDLASFLLRLRNPVKRCDSGILDG